MAETFAAAMETRKIARRAPPTLMQQAGPARWALDTTQLRPFIDAVAQGEVLGAEWVEDVLAAARVTDVNQEVVRRVGPYFGQDELVDRPVGAFWPAESRLDLAELILEVGADRSSEAMVTRRISSLLLRDPDLTVWRTPANGPDTMFVEIVGAARDHRSNWALRASEERYRKLIHHLPLALVQLDARELGAVLNGLRAEGVNDLDTYLDAHPELIAFAKESVRITEVNRSAALLFGATSSDKLVGPLEPLFAGSPETTRHVMVARFEGHRNYSEVTKLRTLDGRILDVRLSVTYPTPPEQLDVTLISLEDLTDSLRTETQLRQLQADFSRAARISTLGELAASIAHEVNQPLAAILTNAETSLRWLSREEPNLAKVGQLTARIATSARRASDIVQRIRSMAAKPNPERTSLDLNELVEEALLFVRHDLDIRSMDLSLDLAAGLPTIFGDRIQLQQVIVNLLVNGIQAIVQAEVEKGRLALSTTLDEQGGLLLQVKDNGPGIADEHLERVFEGFFTTKAEGIGIGLAICQSIAAAHGGEITAANAPEGGACFRLRLPAETVAAGD